MRDTIQDISKNTIEDAFRDILENKHVGLYNK
jgi:hypothetical protein